MKGCRDKKMNVVALPQAVSTDETLLHITGRQDVSDEGYYADCPLLRKSLSVTARWTPTRLKEGLWFDQTGTLTRFPISYG